MPEIEKMPLVDFERLLAQQAKETWSQWRQTNDPRLFSKYKALEEAKLHVADAATLAAFL